MRCFSLAALALLAALPAVAQDRGGIAMRSNPYSELSQIEANRGCPQSVTSVSVGVNKTFGLGASAQQQLATQNAAGGANGCRPLVSTQVVAGANLALGGRSNASQSIQAQGPRGILSTNTYTRGYNVGFGANSIANQRLSNLIGQ